MTDINWLERAEQVDLRIRHFIDGKHSSGSGTDTIPKCNPRDGRMLYELNVGSGNDVDHAVAAARMAFNDGRWAGKPVQQRKDVLHKLAGLVESHKEELALLECLDVGKPISSALSSDVLLAAGTIRYYAEAADKILAHAFVDGAAPNLSYQIRKPVGVVGGIVGWNYPLVLAASKAAPALAAGNSLVLKPSELTSLAAGRLAELALDAGVPPGVFNVVCGAGSIVGNALAHHPDINLLSFTGSTATGKQLMIAAGNSNMKRLILECGGKSPYLVFDDCPEDLERIAQHVVETAFLNQGEVCVAGTRLLIQANIKDDFLSKVLAHAARLTPNDPLDSSTTFGALISESHLKKVLGYIECGKAEGARLAYSGEHAVSGLDGFYLGPVIFDDVNPEHRIAREEIFGPVLSVFSFEDEAEAIEIANNCTYGLAAYVATTSLGRAHRLGQRLDSGMVTVLGTAYPQEGGGELGISAFKESGFGHEGGIEGLANYTVPSAIQVFI